jgi:hypothetical protein
MPSALSGVTSSLPRGQTKKTETGGTSPPSIQPPAAEPAAAASEPPSATMTHGGSPDGSAVSPMPDRLRDLIVEQSSRAAPFSTSLHELMLRTVADGRPVTPAEIQRTRAEIIAQAGVSIVAQANHTGSSVRALLAAAG